MLRSVQIKKIYPDHHRTYLTSPIRSFERKMCESLSLYGNIYPYLDLDYEYFSYQEQQIRTEMFLSKHPLFNYVNITARLEFSGFPYT